MITTADALELMAVITACHQRTAPRMDDRDVALATARVWVDLFADFDFTKAELIAAVKNRAKVCPDAPEAADIIRVARSTRSDQMTRLATDINDARHQLDNEHFPGDTKAAPDPAEYPKGWTTDQRTSAYWFAMRMNAIPHTTSGWEAIAKQLERKRAENPLALPAPATKEPSGSVAAKIAAARASLDSESVAAKAKRETK